MRKKDNMAVAFEAVAAASPNFVRFRGLPVARELAAKESLPLFLCFKEKKIDKGTVMYMAQDNSEGIMYLILEGSVSVSDSPRHIYSILGAGDVFGLFSFLDQERLHSASIQARSNLTVLSLKREYFDAITIEDPMLGNQLLRFMFRLLSRMTLKLEVEYSALRETHSEDCS
ncbi:MAG: Crp/Fnr family transcriptional regulator [Mariprofundaceae bacterium]